jgi:hypothetical protein
MSQTLTVDTDAQIRALQDRLAAAQRARVRAEHERDAATASARTAAEALRAEFGVSTVDEATTLLAGLEKDLAVELAAVSDQLDRLAL